MTFKDRFRNLANEARKKGLHVHFVRNLKDYAGMNWKIARSMGYSCAPKTILIASNMTWETKYRTLRHELVEVGLMKSGMKYWPAHCRALKSER